MARLLIPLLLSVPLAAQGLLIQPHDPPPDVHHEPQPPHRQGDPRHNHRPVVELKKSAIRAEIVDGVATTIVEQTFFNHGRRVAEGTWFLPLPAGAVADGFTMTVGGKELKGEVLDAGQARSIYESIVRSRRDPGLLEYAGEGMLRARVFPIPAQGEVVVTVRLRQILQPLGNIFEWQWPLRSTRYGDTGQGLLTMDVKISSQTRISTVVSPQSEAEIQRSSDREARVTYEGEGRKLEDLRVLYGLSEQEFGLHLLTWREMANPGYFVMLMSPPRELDKPAPRRCVQFVVDTSGSMKGDKIRQAKAALVMFLESLRPHDMFQVVTFSSSVQTFFDGSRLANAENIAAAAKRVEQLEAKGGTNIAEALQRALDVGTAIADDDGPWLGQIVFVTDGQPTVGVTAPDQIMKLAKKADRNKTRLFALGVGDEIDVRLIDDLVEQHRGARDFVRNREKIELKVDALCRKISQPALTDVVISCDGLDSFDVHPARTRDVFCGEMLQVVGRYRNHGMKTVRLRGMQSGKQREFVFEVEFPKLSERHTFVQTVWARHHVAALLDAIRRNGANKELVDEVRRLATRYGIVTPYTSQLIVEEGMRLGDRRGRPIYRGPGDLAPQPGGPATGGPGAVDGRGVVRTAAGPSSPGGAYRGPTTPAERLRQLGKQRTGAQAVQESITTSADALHLGGGRRTDSKGTSDAEPLVRRAAGRVFVGVGDDLVEQGLPADWAKQAVAIDSFSDDYFALLRENPKLREILALGERVVFRHGERIVHVRPLPKKSSKK